MNRKTFRVCLAVSLGIHAVAAVLLFFRWEDSLYKWSGGRFDPGAVITVNLSLGDFARQETADPAPPQSFPASQNPDTLQVPEKPTPKPPKQKTAERKSEASGAPAVSSGRGNSPTPAGGAGEGYDASDVEVPASEVLALIRQRILRAKRYPPMARRQGVEGNVEVRFQIAPDGKLGSASVTRSSGSALLDEEALATLNRGAPYLFYPGEIRMSLKFALEE